MSRMSRELTLVVLGAGVLSAGHFLVPSVEAEMEAKSDEQAAERTGHSRVHGRGFMPFFLFMHSPAYAGSRTGKPAAFSATTRSGGIGTVAKNFGGARA